ncbi:Stk1 family PASTA domain-containing Ser/Thr kinase [Cellulosimicrobium protaetiae]|uniref:non-specific serine/threonine protein kinase n=1 Tax=Cellulosimicrobium protaetiae TaxID=2587808 RepID=A0A6M5UFY7_9MICO|nr:Stk1 family PASTA domain-containing Ser/Thr kinase [Cellulosimicrobium protaetiae]QJW36562.1 Stk1 family PASTA domain-containing Ser/Thr kinase [Cellulosimicrobium protaetiae]
MATVTTDPLVGRLVDGRYEVVSRIARGGMATVYLAVDRRLEREVALKVMHAHLAEGASGADFVSRFRREARAAARLTHPGLVAVYDQGLDGDTSYLTMEYVAGSNLRRTMLTERTLPLGRTLDVLEDVLEALAAAHRAGLVHRDVKPENVLLDTEGRLKVTDFGLARAVNEVTATTTGTILGTVAYLSPELIATGACDARTDVYAVGILAYEMLLGTVPHTGTTPIQVAFQHVNNDVPPPSDVAPWIPPEVDDLLCALAARDPADRPADAGAALALVRTVRAALDPADLERRVDPPVTADAVGPASEGAEPGPAAEHRTAATAPLAVLSLQDREAAGLTEPLAVGHVVTPTTRPGPPPPPAPAVAVGRRRRGRVLAWSLVVLLVLASAGGGAAWWFSSGPGAYTLVPSGLVEASRTEAAAILDDASLDHTIEERYDDTVPEGAVVASEPGSGESVRKDGSVQLVVSKGVRMLTVPTGLVGATQDEATAALEGADLTVGEPVAQAHDEVPEGQVMAVEDGDGNVIEEGATIRHDVPVVLTVSSGPAPVVVPQVTGSAKDAAVQALEDQGLVAAVTEEYSESVAAGLVIRQDPEQGTDARRTDTVNVVVSLGPPLVEVPDTYGTNVKAAEKALRDAGFEVEVRHPQGISPLNIVYAQDPPGGDGRTAPKGSTIVINVF